MCKLEKQECPVKPEQCAGGGVMQEELPLTAGGGAEWCGHFGRHSGSFYKIKHALSI